MITLTLLLYEAHITWLYSDSWTALFAYLEILHVRVSEVVNFVSPLVPISPFVSYQNEILIYNTLPLTPQTNMFPFLYIRHERKIVVVR